MSKLLKMVNCTNFYKWNAQSQDYVGHKGQKKVSVNYNESVLSKLLLWQLSRKMLRCFTIAVLQCQREETRGEQSVNHPLRFPGIWSRKAVAGFKLFSVFFLVLLSQQQECGSKYFVAQPISFLLLFFNLCKFDVGLTGRFLNLRKRKRRRLITWH